LGSLASVLWTLLLAADPPAAPAAASTPPGATESGSEAADPSDVAEEPAGGAGVSPIEIVPRLELRQSFQQFKGGVFVNATTAEMDIQFARRILLRYVVPVEVLKTPTGQVAGVGDIQLGALGIVYSDATSMAVLILGSVLNTATQPPLGQGKQQILFGAGAAIKPRRWLLPYCTVEEQISVGGDKARLNINELMIDLGTILFGRQYNWLKADLLPTFDFPGGTTARLFGTFEAGALLVGRVGLFVRAGTQLAGSSQLDYSVAGGLRYLFRLEHGKPASDR
jgi:hypothetical protein